MSVVAWGRGDTARQRPNSAALLPVLLVPALFLARLFSQARFGGPITLEDDAYYYTVIAQHIAQSGLSTFDGQVLTNGYHPLWLLVLTAQAFLVGGSPLVTIGIELTLVTGVAALFMSAFRTSSPLFKVLFAVCFYLLAWPMVARGMEVSLFLFCFALFLRLWFTMRDGRGSALAVGLAATAAIGARIDSAVFVVPIALLGVRSLRDGVSMLAPVALAGVAYAAINLWLFGIAFPVSGIVKSLGGFQVNDALIGQARSYFAPRSSGLAGLLAFVNSFLGRPILLFALPCLLLPFLRRPDKSRRLIVGATAGFVLFAVKLLLFSSWVVWAWYAFPALIGLAALFHGLDDLLARWKTPLIVPAQWIVAALLALAAGLQVRSAAARPEPSFEPLNIAAVRQLAPVLHGERVAMGDRAGSFAAHYSGGVTQLEGLVNDVAYAHALETHADLRPLLCARGVRFVLSYQRDLGAYGQAVIPVLRPALTTYRAPALTFAKSDEVGRVSDLALFDNSASEEGDNYLYAWRLRCDAAQ